MSLFKKLIPYILVIILSSFSILPLFQSGFFPVHDDTQVQRVYEMAESLKAGMFPVRWVSDLGYGLGYPIFNFYAPLAYYFGAKFVLFGLDALISTKIMIAFGMLFSGFSMYLLSKEFFGKLGGIVSSLLYVYFPYHAVNLYVRGAISELWGYAFIPLCFYGFYKLFKEEKYFYVIVSVIGFSGIILSHNLTAMMIAPFLIILLFILGVLSIKLKNKKNIFYLTFAFLLSFLVTAFYWLPAILEMNNTSVSSTIGGGADFRDHFVCLSQLWYSQWGFGGSTNTCIDGLSFMLGKINILILLFSIIGFASFKIFKKERKIFYVLLFSILGLTISIFLLLSQSRFVWENILPMKYFQYPWRFLNMVGFFMAFVSGVSIYTLEKLLKNKFLVYSSTVLLVILIIIINISYFQPQKILNKTANDYTNKYSLRWVTSKISDEYLPKNTKKPKNAEEALISKRTFSFQENSIEKASDVISIAGILIVVLGIIFTRKKKIND